MVYYIITLIIIILLYIIYNDSYIDNFEDIGLCVLNDTKDEYTYDNHITLEECKSKVYNHTAPEKCKIKWVPVVNYEQLVIQPQVYSQQVFKPTNIAVDYDKHEKNITNKEGDRVNEGLNNQINNHIGEESGRPKSTTNVNNVATTKINYK